MKIQRPPAAAPAEDLTDYWWLLKPWLKTIALVTVAAVVITALVAEFGLNHYYRATAVIRPVSKSDQSGSMSGVLAGVGNTIGSLAGLSTDEDKDAQEYMSILNSYAFTTELLKSTNLPARLTARSLSHRILGWSLSHYRIYEKMGDLFDSDYSTKSGNITLTFIEPDPELAQKILAKYVDQLRAQLRRREIEEATAAIDSLDKMAASTSDAQLQASLYDYIGKQIERRAMAQVQADFSFKVIEPSVVSDRVYEPKVLLDAVLAAVVIPLLVALIIIISDRMSAGRYSYWSDATPAPASPLEPEQVPVSQRARRQG